MKEFLQIVRSLSDETRLRLFQLLLTQDLCGKALARHLSISGSAVSQHLKNLQKAGLVKGEKRGYWVHYGVDRQALQRLIAELQLMTKQISIAAGPCSTIRVELKGVYGKEVKKMCQSCCQVPEKLKEKPQECTPEQIKECHGNSEKHPCVEDKEKQAGRKKQ
jgi:ArsR family transcriptional regulator, arsenate/arsenite/antimonite-responsive transcriptional repressor